MAVRDVVQAAAGALGGAAGDALYVEDVFSTHLYTGNGNGNSVYNGILLADGAANGTHLHLTGDNLTDSAPTANTLTVTGNTAVSTSVKKYGTGSIAFDGSGDYITTQTGVEHTLGGNFTIEFWVQSSLGGDQGLFCINKLSSSGQDGIAIRFSGTSLQYWVAGTGTVYTASGSYSSSTWYHIALVRYSGTNTLYVNGSSVHTSTQTPTFNSSQAIGIGRTYNDNASYTLNGYIDDLRVTKGRAVYTGAFTPPTAALDLDTSATGEGGMVWTKSRSNSGGSFGNTILDTERGGSATLVTNTTNASAGGDRLTFNANGYTILSTAGTLWNNSGSTYASWTWRKAPKFFDVVTWTGDGTNPRAISHNLGSVPGCYIVKCTSNNLTDWRVYHRSLGSGSPEDYNLKLHATDAQATTSHWANTAPTDSVFYVSSATNVNASGNTYVAYLFAHEDGGFGADGTEDVISCGTITTDASTPSVFNNKVTLGWEPQWVLMKNVTSASSWVLIDNMRGITDSETVGLYANTSDAEGSQGANYRLEPDGFNFKLNVWGYSQKIVYIAIRRPMKTPTAGTDVLALHPLESSPFLTPGWPVDFGFWRPTTTYGWLTSSRLTAKKLLYFNLTDAEATEATLAFDYQNRFTTETSQSSPAWMFKRAPGFFDVVAYTGAGSGTSFSHNLGVTPELIIFKSRSNAEGWITFYNNSDYLWLNLTNAKATATNFLTRTSTSVTTNASSTPVNYSGYTYVAYLFATLAGVSKVGSYTGTTSDINVDCGFSAGARFVLIKRTDSTGDWYLWDSVRGIVAGNDPYLLLNSTAAEVTTTDYIDPYSAGFTVTSSAPAALNASGGTYIFLAIA